MDTIALNTKISDVENKKKANFVTKTDFDKKTDKLYWTNYLR